MIDYLKQMYGTICLIGSVALKLRAKGKQFRKIDATKMQLRLAGNEVNINQCRNIAAHFRVKFSIPSSQLFLTSDFIHSSNKAADSAPDEKLVWKLGAVSYKECKPSDSVSNTKYDNQSKFIPFISTWLLLLLRIACHFSTNNTCKSHITYRHNL